jgi:hypothetical protein
LDHYIGLTIRFEGNLSRSIVKFFWRVGAFKVQFAAAVHDKRLTVDLRNASRGTHVLVQAEFGLFAGAYRKICPSGRNNTPLMNGRAAHNDGLGQRSAI